MPVFARVILFCFGYVRVKVVGSPAPHSKAPVWVVAPHSSMFDPFVLLLVQRFSVVSRLENNKGIGKSAFLRERV